jgi:hypothetical protein
MALHLALAAWALAGVTPESPEVQKLVASGLAFLEHPTEEANANKLGGKCLMALAFLKAGKGDHAMIGRAVEACDNTIKTNPPEGTLDNYSNGLAIIFLCELSPQKYGRQIEWYLDHLKKVQKDHGGWGYFGVPSGDTSQTQYGTLSYWEANRRGFNVDGGSVDNLATWLLRTQGPDGCWGYQGNLATNDTPVQQNDTNCSMLAAGLGSMYICADLFGMHPKVTSTSEQIEPASALPAALRPVTETVHAGEPKHFRPVHANAAKISQAISHAQAWMDKNYSVDMQQKSFYFLYGLERYKSFQESFEVTADPSPQWYNDGYNYLVSKQSTNGSWSGYCGANCDTAFAILFLLRSTQKSIHAKLGEGMLLAGRGLPTNLSRAKLHNGQLIVEQVHTKVDELLSMIDDGDEAKLDDLARDPNQLVVDQVDEKSARRLQQLVRGGEPGVRLLAVRALGRTGNLDYVPSLLYALTDPDRRIVLEARNELRFISRNFDGIGPPDDYTEQQRYQARDTWKKWYQSIRPTAVLEK